MCFRDRGPLKPFGELEMNVRKEAEIVGYDYQKYEKKTLKRMLRILRNVYNYY